MNQTVVDSGGEALVATLRAELDRLVAGTDERAAGKALLDGSAGRDLYVSYLVQTRHYVALTYPCLSGAGRRMKELGQHDFLADLLFQKAEEEEDHDVLIDNDLRALGLSAEKTLEEQGAGGWITAYNAWIKAATQGRHPASFLGSAYVLEGLAVHRAGPSARALRAKRGIDGIEKATTFLELHAEADISHVDDMERILGGLTDPAEQEAIIMTAAATREAYLGMLDELADAHLKPALHA
ncbi:iron-containing redox enzyme family protein [Methylobacterium organophilum]|uniref:iron-containing redox enzyme family protein n=1 Tax=Methylobacterium organophilum TaxID=410 RepID=UPI001F147B1A|nr:iron-containing redox enzyme family protein [Methylobacterium organophilum]UMY15543.1 iron-containing redox enzyme family protein [Methylobacterium organophilum]